MTRSQEVSSPQLQPLTVSVVTSTWRRADVLLNRCVPSVEIQSVPALEHIIVSDGPDEALAYRVDGLDRADLRLFHLPTHESEKHWGALPRKLGVELSRGDAIAFLDDDNAYRPEHLETLAGALEASKADFVFSQAQVWRGRFPTSQTIGGLPLALGRIDTSIVLARRELFEQATWRTSGYTEDWDLVERWLELGATYVFVPRVTIDYYAH